MDRILTAYSVLLATRATIYFFTSKADDIIWTAYYNYIRGPWGDEI